VQATRKHDGHIEAKLSRADEATLNVQITNRVPSGLTAVAVPQLTTPGSGFGRVMCLAQMNCLELLSDAVRTRLRRSASH
jgi:hypothetical protein